MSVPVRLRSWLLGWLPRSGARSDSAAARGWRAAANTPSLPLGVGTPADGRRITATAAASPGPPQWLPFICGMLSACLIAIVLRIPFESVSVSQSRPHASFAQGVPPPDPHGAEVRVLTREINGLAERLLSTQEQLTKLQTNAADNEAQLQAAREQLKQVQAAGLASPPAVAGGPAGAPRPDQCSMLRTAWRVDRRALPLSAASVSRDDSTGTAGAQHGRIAGGVVLHPTLVSPALDAPHTLLPHVMAHASRLATLDHMLSRHDNHARDAAELALPWLWASTPELAEQQRIYARNLYLRRLVDFGGKALGGSEESTASERHTLFAWDVRFSRFHGGMPLLPVSDVAPAVAAAVGHGQQDSLSLLQQCERPLSYDPSLFQRLPCPVIWQSHGKVRWNLAAEKGMYHLVKEQQFPSQHLLFDGAAAATKGLGALDCTKLKYTVIFGMTKGHGFFSRWKWYIKFWKAALAMDPSRIVVWAQHRMAVAHSVEADTLEEGIVRYLQDLSPCANHPFVRRVIRDHHDGDTVHRDRLRYMPSVLGLANWEESLDPANQAVQFWKIGIEGKFVNGDPADHMPHRHLLFDVERMQDMQRHQRTNEGDAGFTPPSALRRQVSFSSAEARWRHLQHHSPTERIFPTDSGRAHYDPNSATAIQQRSFLFGDFVTSILSMMAFRLQPDVQAMTNQLERHWAEEVWDAAMERVRDAEQRRLDEERKPLSDTKDYDPGIASEQAWRVAEMAAAAALRRDLQGASSSGVTHRLLAPQPPAASSVSSSAPSCFMSPTTATDPPLGFDPSLHSNSFASIHPVAAFAIRRGDKMAEDPFYLKFGHFRPLSMFVWRLWQAQEIRTRDLQRAAEAAAIAAGNSTSTVPEVPFFRYRSLFVMTDDVPVLEEVMACSRMPAIVFHNATHRASLLAEAVEAERAVVEEQTRVGQAKLRETGGQVKMDADGVFTAASKLSGPVTCTSPLSRLVLGGMPVLHNVFAPQRCFHPFVRVGFQQFLVSFNFVVRNVQMWVGPRDSSVTQVLDDLTHAMRQMDAQAGEDMLLQIDTEKVPLFQL